MSRGLLGPLPTALLTVGCALALTFVSGCAILEWSACGDLTYREGTCQGWDGFRWVQRPPAHWVPGAKS